MLRTFQRKPVELNVVPAIQHNGDLSPVKKFTGIKDANYDTESRDFILENNQVVHIGDWIIKNPNGEFIKKTNEELFDQYVEILSEEL